MKYRCDWVLRGVGTFYSGSLEVNADDEDTAGRLAKRLLWAQEFRDRNIGEIKIQMIKAA